MIKLLSGEGEIKDDIGYCFPAITTEKQKY